MCITVVFTPKSVVLVHHNVHIQYMSTVLIYEYSTYTDYTSTVLLYVLYMHVMYIYM